MTANKMTDMTVAYFCMEYGLHESLPLYSGGLGVLAGDMLKAAQDADYAFVAVGILWEEGYTLQRITCEGSVEDYNDKVSREHFVPLKQRVSVRIGTRDVLLRAFEVKSFGCAPLYLLEPVEEADRWITRRLYCGDEATRVAQEIVLGIGGVRLLRALNISVGCYHFNEGHAVFAGLELIGERMAAGNDFAAAHAAVRQEVVFTTHTPVRAGNEAHPVDLLMTQGAHAGALTAEQLRLLGGDPFEMTVAALRLARRTNGVSELHGVVAAEMWRHVEGASDIVSITNGVHQRTWQDPRIREAMEVGPDGLRLGQVKRTLKCELLRDILQRTGTALDKDALLVGFARRAASYKRAVLVFHDLTRLEPLLAAGRVNLVFSGKAHPQDNDGRALLAKIVAMARLYPQSVVFLENYGMELGRLLTRGCDVWLNTPRKPNEASGTSGMKAALNGGLNLSIMDGWWAEGCRHGQTGWAFGGLSKKSDANKDDLDAADLGRVLRDEVLPCWENEQTRWAAMMTQAIEMAEAHYTAAVMLRKYHAVMYQPGESVG